MRVLPGFVTAWPRIANLTTIGPCDSQQRMRVELPESLQQGDENAHEYEQ